MRKLATLARVFPAFLALAAWLAIELTIEIIGPPRLERLRRLADRRALRAEGIMMKRGY